MLDIENACGVQNFRNPGKYFGLPTTWRRSKNEAPWVEGVLNNVSREVLIKAVITKIPTYVMSVFKLPTT